MVETQKALSPYYIQNYKQRVKKTSIQMLAIKHNIDLAWLTITCNISFKDLENFPSGGVECPFRVKN